MLVILDSIFISDVRLIIFHACCVRCIFLRLTVLINNLLTSQIENIIMPRSEGSGLFYGRLLCDSVSTADVTLLIIKTV
jgi:hypothetical protein